MQDVSVEEIGTPRVVPPSPAAHAPPGAAIIRGCPAARSKWCRCPRASRPRSGRDPCCRAPAGCLASVSFLPEVPGRSVACFFICILRCRYAAWMRDTRRHPRGSSLTIGNTSNMSASAARCDRHPSERAKPVSHGLAQTRCLLHRIYCSGSIRWNGHRASSFPDVRVLTRTRGRERWKLGAEPAASTVADGDLFVPVQSAAVDAVRSGGSGAADTTCAQRRAHPGVSRAWRRRTSAPASCLLALPLLCYQPSRCGARMLAWCHASGQPRPLDRERNMNHEKEFE